jgi:serine protease Do
MGPRLGVMINYADDKGGVLLEGLSNDKGPAAKAGLKAGDRIMSIGGKETRNVESYMAVMRGFKKGDTIEIKAVRNGKEEKFKVILE